jgi:biotin carboxyl carrier protein
MTLYHVTISGNEYQVNLAGDQSTVNGEPVQAGISLINNNGSYLLRRTKQNVDLFLNAQNAETYNLLVGSRRVVTRVVPDYRYRTRRTEIGTSDVADITAPMNGVVIEVLTEEGCQVEQGQNLMTLESMKMQMQMRASRSGRVVRIAVSPNQQVEKGCLLIRIE